MRTFQATSYKEILRQGVVRPKTFSAMAEHCRVQKTYLSKVINRDAHLNEDQLFLALDYIGLAEEERQFALILHSVERSQLASRRALLERQIALIRAKKLKTESYLDVSTQDPQQALTAYYLDPLYQVVHMLLTIKRFQQHPARVGEAIGLKPTVVRKYLLGLKQMGLIGLSENKGSIVSAKVLKDNLHLRQDSTLHPAYSARMRLKAIERMDQLEKSEAYSFSAVFSTSPKVREQIHASFVEWLQSVQKAVQKGSEDEVYQINFDLLKWS